MRQSSLTNRQTIDLLKLARQIPVRHLRPPLSASKVRTTTSNLPSEGSILSENPPMPSHGARLHPHASNATSQVSAAPSPANYQQIVSEHLDRILAAQDASAMEKASALSAPPRLKTRIIIWF